MPKWLKIVLALLALVIGVILILFIVARATGYGNLGAMFSHLWGQISFIWNERLKA